MTSPFSPEQQKVLTQKIGEQIEEQLGERNDMLVEYVMVMCNNGKETAAVEADLVELIGAEAAATFSAWLGAAQEAIFSEHANEDENEPTNDVVEQSASVQDEGGDSKNEQEKPAKRVRQGGLLMSALAQTERNPPARSSNIFSRVGKIKQQKEERATRRQPERIAVLSGSGEDDNSSGEDQVIMPYSGGSRKRKVTVGGSKKGDDLVFTVKADPAPNSWVGGGKGGGKGDGGGWAAQQWGKGAWGKGSGKGSSWFPHQKPWSAGGGKGGKKMFNSTVKAPFVFRTSILSTQQTR